MILDDLEKRNINYEYLVKCKGVATSYTDVMSANDDNTRTFYHFRGANDKFDGSQIKIEILPIKIFHLGYLILLEAMDKFIDTD